MDKTLFDDLKQSLKEAKAIRAEEINASRRFSVSPIDAKAVRAKAGLSYMEMLRCVMRLN